MEAQLRAYRAVIRLWSGSKTNNVYDQRDRSDQFQFQKGNEKRSVPQLDRVAQAVISTSYGIREEEAKWAYSELVAGLESIDGQ